MNEKIALVTGATRGIGRAISLKLADEGAKVFALYGRDRASADALADAITQNCPGCMLRRTPCSRASSPAAASLLSMRWRRS